MTRIARAVWTVVLGVAVGFGFLVIALCLWMLAEGIGR